MWRTDSVVHAAASPPPLLSSGSTRVTAASTCHCSAQDLQPRGAESYEKRFELLPHDRARARIYYWRALRSLTMAAAAPEPDELDRALSALSSAPCASAGRIYELVHGNADAKAAALQRGGLEALCAALLECASAPASPPPLAAAAALSRAVRGVCFRSDAARARAASAGCVSALSASLAAAASALDEQPALADAALAAVDALCAALVALASGSGGGADECAAAARAAGAGALAAGLAVPRSGSAAADGAAAAAASQKAAMLAAVLGDCAPR